MHYSTSCQVGEMSDTINPLRSQTIGIAFFKDSRLFQEAGHEGGDELNDADSEGVLFVPEGCIRRGVA
jgi:hypothetical protein